MRGDSNVAVARRKHCSWNMPRTLSQDSGVIAFEDHHRYPQARNLELTDYVTSARRRRQLRLMDDSRPDQPFFRAALCGGPFMQCPHIPRQESSAPNDESAAEPDRPS